MPSLPPFAPPLADATPIRLTSIRHPAYPDTELPLLRLAAIDGESHGLDHQFALTVCGILTGNSWTTGYLATKNADGTFLRIERQANDILLDSTYYYLLSTHDSSYKYPVTLSFQHYRFPHGDLPSFWDNVQIPNLTAPIRVNGKVAALVRDGTCRVTAWATALEVAHLVPYSEEKWFLSNGMNRFATRVRIVLPGLTQARYCTTSSSSKPTEDRKNLITLTRDQHYHFDHRHYTIVPSQDEDSTSLELRVLDPGSDEQLIPNYHTRTLQPITDISVEFLHARLAWSIFCDSIFPFFKGSAEYEALVFIADKGGCETVKLRSLEVPARSRSVSPRKRKVRDVDADAWSSAGESWSSQEDSLSSDDSLHNGT
ncbi:hypothetical protein CCM_02474 [Cordyceps militaris CM01]|uniref:HNH nuclease domain-containing protein n=1 Tax=Cordyceps militaris (strain CM01) TaxID=983644 RepID=G3J9Y0_CORMM|nr:uncharacterized protein CCM_02474 [Cordyceps militaris CM01]EGX94203.1 hypothetical protein CCM_02474 [Cordyceps militaris CM01]